MKTSMRLHLFAARPEVLLGRALGTQSSRVARDWREGWCWHIFLLKESLLSSASAAVPCSCAQTGVKSSTPSWQWPNTSALRIPNTVSRRLPERVWTMPGSKDVHAIPCGPVVQEFHPKGGHAHRTKNRYPNPSKSCRLRR